MKERFMNRLASYLEALSEDEREEILTFYEERFHTGKLYEGKSEAEIIAELEDPEDIARNVLREYGKPFNAREHYYKKETNSTLDVGSLVGVVLFDLFVASWFIPALFSVIVGFLAALGGIGISLVFAPLTTSGSPVFIVLVGIGLLFFGLLFVLWLYDIFVTFIAWLLGWHLKALNLGFKDWPKRIRKLRVSYFFKKRPKTNRVKNQLKFVALVMVLVGGTIQLINFNTLRIDLGATEMVSETTEETVSDLQGWTVSGSMHVGDVTFHTHALDTVRIESHLPEEAEVSFSINDEAQTITLNNRMQLFMFNIGTLFNIFTDDMYVDVYLPEDLVLSEIDIEQMNGDISIQDHTLDRLELETTNGNLHVENVDAVEPMDLSTTNGNVSVLSSSSAVLEATSTNGRIEIREGTYDDVDVTTTNGKITIQNINDTDVTDTVLWAKTTNGSIDFLNVYMNDVTMRSTNGSLTYENDDSTFVVDSLTYNTTNGSATIRVPYMGNTD